LARAWRKHYQNSLIAVAGSNGKTTVKSMLGTIMRHDSRSRVLSTRGNLNNHIGVPLTLLRLGSRHRCAVVELGANHPGEISLLASIAQPTVALITNAGLDHLAGLGGAEGAARATCPFRILSNEIARTSSPRCSFSYEWTGSLANTDCRHPGTFPDAWFSSQRLL